jgi:predicted PurR-regulated permease PerM
MTPPGSTRTPATPPAHIALAIAGGIALLLIVWFTRYVLLLAFAGVLLAVALRTPADWLHRRVGLPPALGVLLVFLATVLLLVGAFLLKGDEIARQADELRRAVPAAWDQFRQWVDSNAIGRMVTEVVTDPSSASGAQQAAAQVGLAVVQTVSILGAFVVLLFIGIVIALNPAVYRDGAMRLVPPRGQERARQVVDKLGSTLRWWLFGRVISMTVIGVATYIGLLVLKVPLPSVLALIAGLLTFIPNIGPVVAAVPAILLGFTESPQLALYVVLLYVAVQAVESFILEPIVDHHSIQLPPALIVVGQALFGVFAGVAGVALATPIVASAVVLVRMLYLDEES